MAHSTGPFVVCLITGSASEHASSQCLLTIASLRTWWEWWGLLQLTRSDASHFLTAMNANWLPYLHHYEPVLNEIGEQKGNVLNAHTCSKFCMQSHSQRYLSIVIVMPGWCMDVGLPNSRALPIALRTTTEEITKNMLQALKATLSFSRCDMLL